MSKLVRIFIIVLVALVLIALVFHEPNQKIRPEQLNFHVNDGDALYFRNLRQFYYQKEVVEDAGFDIFRLKPADMDSTGVELRFAIVNNWRNDQAYIMLEATALAKINDTIHVEIQSNGQSEILRLGAQSMPHHLDVAYALYTSLSDRKTSFHLLTEDGKVALWISTQERDNTLRVLKDYFKLTGALR